MAWKDKAKQDEYWDRVKGKYNTSFKVKYASDPVFRSMVLDRCREWRKNNPETYKETSRKQSSKRLKLRFEIFKRDKFACQYCGRTAPSVVLEIDHVVPKSKGGLNCASNYKTACRECNNGKRDFLL